VAGNGLSGWAARARLTRQMLRVTMVVWEEAMDKPEARMKEAFDQFDTDHDGCLDTSEFSQLVKAFLPHCDDRTALIMFREALDMGKERGCTGGSLTPEVRGGPVAVQRRSDPPSHVHARRMYTPRRGCALPMRVASHTPIPRLARPPSSPLRLKRSCCFSNKRILLAKLFGCFELRSPEKAIRRRGGRCLWRWRTSISCSTTIPTSTRSSSSCGSARCVARAHASCGR
jgi:hypothetical protein